MSGVDVDADIAIDNISSISSSGGFESGLEVEGEVHIEMALSHRTAELPAHLRAEAGSGSVHSTDSEDSVHYDYDEYDGAMGGRRLSSLTAPKARSEVSILFLLLLKGVKTYCSARISGKKDDSKEHVLDYVPIGTRTGGGGIDNNSNNSNNSNFSSNSNNAVARTSRGAGGARTEVEHHQHQHQHEQIYNQEQVNAAKLITRILPFLGVFVMFWCIYSQMAVGFQNQVGIR